MSKPKTKNTRVKLILEDKEKLEVMAERLNMNQNVIIGYLLDQAIKYDMFDPAWIEKALDAKFQEMLLDADIEYRKQFQRDKYRSVLRIQERMIEARLKTLPENQRIEFIDNILGTPDHAGDIIDRLTSTQIYNVNGEKKMLMPDANGKPRLAGLPPSQIVECPRGYHTVLDNCVACSDRIKCETRKKYIEEWLALHGTSQEQERYISSGQFVRRLDK